MPSVISNHRLIAIGPDACVCKEQKEIADLAYEFWLTRCFRRNGSPEESFFSAVLEVTFCQQRHSTRARLFLVPRRTTLR